MAKIKKNLSELRKAVDSCEPAKRELGIKLLDQLDYMENLLSEYQKKIKAEAQSSKQQTAMVLLSRQNTLQVKRMQRWLENTMQWQRQLRILSLTACKNLRATSC